MKAWVELYRQHTAHRTLNDMDLANELRQVFRRLSEGSYAVLRHEAASRLRREIDSRTSTVSYYLGYERKGEKLTLEHLPEPIREQVALKTATLSLQMRLNRREQHLHELNIMLSGIRHDDTSWALAVHLPSDKKTAECPSGDRDGLGACSHASMHCHVGPTLDIKPKVRVPFPPLRPARIVEWAISQAVPTTEFEPAPWPEVEAMLRPS